MTVDPVDDCTFWYTQEYLVTNGAWNWNTRIANFQFPGCTSGSYVGFYPASLSFGMQAVGTTSSAQQITLSNHQPVSLTISSITVSGDYTPDQQLWNLAGRQCQLHHQCQLSAHRHRDSGAAR